MITQNRLLMIAFIVSALLIMALPANAAGGVTATLTPDRTELTVGDPVNLTLEVTHPAGQQVLLPDLPPAWGQFEVQSRQPAETIANPGGTETTRRQFTVTLFQPGTFATPPLPLTIADSAGQVSELLVEPVSLVVAPVLAEGDTTLNDIRPQAELAAPPPWPLLAGSLLAALAVTGFGWWLFRAMQQRRMARANRTPWQAALDELARIDGLKLPQQGQFKEHYTLVTDALRLYLERQHHVPATDRTTAELKRDLAASSLQPDHNRHIINLFADADLVKFAKVTPEPDEAAQLTTQARTLINLTRPVPQAGGEQPASAVNPTQSMEAAR
ncbi:MAG: hypothetical protein Kow0031_28580 [Anaerolineae bacterium]